MPVISSFEVLYQQIAPSSSSSNSGTGQNTAAQQGRSQLPSFPSQNAAEGDSPSPPEGLQGFFLLISNQTGSPLPVRVTFTTSSVGGAQALAAQASGSPPNIPPYVFLAITNTQDPTASGNTQSGINTSGIYFSGLTVSGQQAYIDLPESLPPSGTFLFSLVPNFLNPNVMGIGPVARGYVSVESPSGSGTVLLTPQTRTVFTNGVGNVAEAAYGLPTTSGGSLFTLSGLD